MTTTAKNGSAAIRVGLVLFDEAHTRVFALRGARIEDAREYTVDIATLRRAHAVPQTSRRLPAAQVRERAVHTARLVVDLHAGCPLDYVLVAGPPWAQALIWQHLPLPLRSRLAGSLDLPVSAGENAILQAMLPSIRLIARKARSAQHRAAVAASYRSRPGTARPFMSAIGGLPWHGTPQCMPALTPGAYSHSPVRL